MNIPILTADVKEKWYSMKLIHPDGTEDVVFFGELQEYADKLDCSPYVDHAPNPLCVIELVKDRGWAIDLTFLVECSKRFADQYY